MNRKRTRNYKLTLESLEDRCVPSAGFLDPTFLVGDSSRQCGGARSGVPGGKTVRHGSLHHAHELHGAYPSRNASDWQMSTLRPHFGCPVFFRRG
jgi:hypothetical protein